MNTLVVFPVFLCVLQTAFAKSSTAAPKVQVYGRYPGNVGEENTLICHVSGFHPPEISIELLKDGEKMADTTQTDLAFEQGWQFHLTRSVVFTPQSGADYTCMVTHMKNSKIYTWDPDM